MAFIENGRFVWCLEHDSLWQRAGGAGSESTSNESEKKRILLQVCEITTPKHEPLDDNEWHERTGCDWTRVPPQPIRGVTTGKYTAKYTIAWLECATHAEPRCAVLLPCERAKCRFALFARFGVIVVLMLQSMRGSNRLVRMENVSRIAY